MSANDSKDPGTLVGELDGVTIDSVDFVERSDGEDDSGDESGSINSTEFLLV